MDAWFHNLLLYYSVYLLYIYIYMHARVQAKLSQLCLTLHDSMDYSPLGFCVYQIVQARILEWVAMSFSRGSSWPRNRTRVSYVSCIGMWVFYCSVQFSSVQFNQSCPILCDPMGCSPPGSSVHGISPARIPEWVAMSFSRGSSWPRDQICVSYNSGGLWPLRQQICHLSNTEVF